MKATSMSLLGLALTMAATLAWAQDPSYSSKTWTQSAQLAGRPAVEAISTASVPVREYSSRAGLTRPSAPSAVEIGLLPGQPAPLRPGVSGRGPSGKTGPTAPQYSSKPWLEAQY